MLSRGDGTRLGFHRCRPIALAIARSVRVNLLQALVAFCLAFIIACAGAIALQVRHKFGKFRESQTFESACDCSWGSRSLDVVLNRGLAGAYYRVWIRTIDDRLPKARATDPIQSVPGWVDPRELPSWMAEHICGSTPLPNKSALVQTAAGGWPFLCVAVSNEQTASPPWQRTIPTAAFSIDIPIQGQLISLPTTVYWLPLIGNAVTIFALICAGTWVLAFISSRRARRCIASGRCPVCRHSLATPAADSLLCPECGWRGSARQASPEVSN